MPEQSVRVAVRRRHNSDSKLNKPTNALEPSRGWYAERARSGSAHAGLDVNTNAQGKQRIGNGDPCAVLRNAVPEVGGRCRVELSDGSRRQSPGYRGVVGHLRRNGGPLLRRSRCLATCHAAMRAALSFAAARFRAATRGSGRTIPCGEQAGRQTGGAQACQQARHQ